MNTFISNVKKHNWNNIGFIISMLIVPVLNFIVFWCVLNINSILLAFQQPVYGQPSVWSLVQFKMVIEEIFMGNSVLTEALINSLIFFSVSLFFMVPATLLLAYFLYKKILFHKFYRFVFFLPSIISVTILTVVFKYVIGVNGPLAAIYDMLGLTIPKFFANSDYALKTIVFYCIWSGFGVNLVLFSSAMVRVPTEVIESSKIDGVGFWRELFSMVIPLIWPTISTVLTLAFVNLFTSSGPIMLFTEGRAGTYTISYWIFEQVYFTKNYEYAAAVGLFFTIIGLPIILLFRKLINKVGQEVEY